MILGIKIENKKLILSPIFEIFLMWILLWKPGKTK